jgi:hypothetical protein
MSKEAESVMQLAMGWMTGVQLMVEGGNFFLCHIIQLPIHWVSGSRSLSVMQPKCEADHSRFNIVWSFSSNFPYIFMALCLSTYMLPFFHIKELIFLAKIKI